MRFCNQPSPCGLAFSIFTLVCVLSFTAVVSASSSDCRCFPGDACWPSQREWNAFNKTLDGRLVPTVPLASPCHDDRWSSYNKKECHDLRKQWRLPEIHYESSSSIMAPYFANRSCDPFLSREHQCVIGTYVQYAVNVSKAEHVSKAIKFAHKHNIRLVIRNTGHDYNGKSTGAGGLGVWMHHLKDIDFVDYKSSHYTGKAIKMGAGVQAIEAYQAASTNNLQVVGGECPTVGLAGGYTQGGGHSALASKYGLAADQTLEWEVIDGTGKYYKANRDENSDLYWALSGGGGGTYGVVLSMTSKAHQDIPVSGASLSFQSDNVTQDVYYRAISKYHEILPSIVDEGVMSVWYFTNESFAIAPLTGPGVPVKKLRSLMRPFLKELKNLNINYTSSFGQFDGFLQQYNAYNGPIEVGIAQYGGRLIPRSVVQKNNSALTDAYRFINHHGGQFIGVGVNVSPQVTGDVYNAVHPAWRDALIDTVVTLPWSFKKPLSQMVKEQDIMTNTLLPKLEALTPDGGCYLNEGDFRQPDFQSVFYGSNYPRLHKIKNKYDPHHMFYATTAVGSEYWQPQSDGRLCKAR